MNREIKFRGKSFDTLEWEYGDLIHAGKDRDIILIEGTDGTTSMCRADTVGQFTGLKDKNGVEIYEGDIVDVWSQGSHITDGIIKWGNGRCGFFIGNPMNSIVWNLSGDQHGCETLKVVGNIYDNPELKERIK